MYMYILLHLDVSDISFKMLHLILLLSPRHLTFVLRFVSLRMTFPFILLNKPEDWKPFQRFLSLIYALTSY